MNSPQRKAQSGAYTANLLGNIRSHLAGLQGYDVMALELIQNADDAKADSISFEITPEGLTVRNSGSFAFCGDLAAQPCGSVNPETGAGKCDFHRIADVGSGGKLSNAENIGRFGIGFVSTYQVTDHPEIHSVGLRLTLYPETGTWQLDPIPEAEGTVFFLPWASNPDSATRQALGVSPVAAEHIEQVVEDLLSVVRTGLLFLRHVSRAEIHRDGKLLLSCTLERDEGPRLVLRFQPTDTAERWHVLRASAGDEAQALVSKFPQLELLNRGTVVSVAMRIEPAPITDGLLYAFLPTEQLTGLPLHINADFFPEADRKAAIFAGHQHEQAWNEMLIGVAARSLAAEPETLLATIGQDQFWDVLGRALDIYTKPSVLISTQN